MKFKQFAGTAFIPTISRLVLAVAFITVGWNKITTYTDYSFDEKTVLERNGISVTTPSATAAALGERRVLLASFRQDEAAQDEPAQDEPAQDEPAQDDPEVETTEDAADEASGEAPGQDPGDDEAAAGDAAEDATGEATDEATGDDDAGADDQPAAGIPAPVTPVALPGEVYRAKSLYRITLLCDEAGWPLPKWCAWLAAVTEFVGGCMLLIGFLSRIWSLGLCFAMGSAFYLVSMNIYQVHTTFPFTFAQDVSKYNAVFSQVGLFVMALGVLLIGPGPLSLDRFIFRPKKESSEIVFDDDSDVEPSSGAARMEV